MEYKRANFVHNFLNAVDTDHMAGWDMFINELNELLVNHKPSVVKAIRDSGLRVHENDSLKVMSDLIHDKLVDTPELRKNLVKAIFLRHQDQSISAEGGQVDKIYSNAGGDIAYGTDINNQKQIDGVNDGFDKLVGDKPNTNNLQVPKETVKAMAEENLKNKMEYNGVSKKVFSGRNIVIGLVVVAVIGAAAFGIYKLTKRN